MAIDDNTSYELTGAQIKDLTSKIKSKADSSSLAPVATSGDYNDLDNLPTLPTVNNGSLTIQQNGTTLDTFTANSSDDKTVNIQTITAETVAPAEEVGAITSSMIDWSTMPGSFSTTEQKTPFTWIDGKPIYKKTVDFGALPNNNNKKVPHGISNLGRIIRIEQSIDNNGSGFLEISSGDANNNRFNFYGTATEIGITVTDDRSGCYAYFTLYYTKTTD